MGQHQLITIPASHYVEKARWALDIGGVQFTEDKWPPLLHYLGMKRAGVRGSHTVPALVTPAGEHICDSSLILQYVHQTCPAAAALYPDQCRDDVLKLEAEYSKRLGVLTRVVIYYYIFQQGGSTVSDLIGGWGAPAWRSAVFRALYWPITALIKSGLKINKPNADKALAKVRDIFAQASELLADGRPFLVAGTTAPSAADITFAALAAPLLSPREYGGYAGCGSPEVTVQGWPGPELAATPAGAHALKLYREHRLVRGGDVGSSVQRDGSTSAHAVAEGSVVTDERQAQARL